VKPLKSERESETKQKYGEKGGQHIFVAIKMGVSFSLKEVRGQFNETLFEWENL
jgi:hypothetical protein